MHAKLGLAVHEGLEVPTSIAVHRQPLQLGKTENPAGIQVSAAMRQRQAAHMEAALERQAAVLEGKVLNRVRAGLPVDPVRIMTQLDM